MSEPRDRSADVLPIHERSPLQADVTAALAPLVRVQADLAYIAAQLQQIADAWEREALNYRAGRVVWGGHSHFEEIAARNREMFRESMPKIADAGFSDVAAVIRRRVAAVLEGR